jgi:glycosyltransferase involved in cell wall biosynthesis
MKITCAIITYNEEKNLPDLLRSVEDVCDEILILDSFSTDRTPDIAKSHPKVRFETHPFDGHIEQKNRSISLSSNDWILSLDGDERLDSTLANSILEWKNKPDDPIVGYRIARLTFHMGEYIYHSGWYPRRTYRLFKKGFAQWTGENPHDFIKIDGKGSVMKGNIIHYSFKDLSHQIDTINKFSSIVAFSRYQKTGKFSLLKCILKPIGKFWEIYLFKLGFLDGFRGLVIALASAFSTFLKYAKIYEMKHGYIERPSNLRESYGISKKDNQ